MAHTLLFTTIYILPIQHRTSPTHHPLWNMAFLFRALHFLYVSATAGALAGQICVSLPRGSFSQKIPIRQGGHHWGKLSSAKSTRKKVRAKYTNVRGHSWDQSNALQFKLLYNWKESPHVKKVNKAIKAQFTGWVLYLYDNKWIKKCSRLCLCNALQWTSVLSRIQQIPEWFSLLNWQKNELLRDPKLYTIALIKYSETNNATLKSVGFHLTNLSICQRISILPYTHHSLY